MTHFCRVKHYDIEREEDNKLHILQSRDTSEYKTIYEVLMFSPLLNDAEPIGDIFTQQYIDNFIKTFKSNVRERSPSPLSTSRSSSPILTRKKDSFKEKDAKTKKEEALLKSMIYAGEVDLIEERSSDSTEKEKRRSWTFKKHSLPIDMPTNFQHAGHLGYSPEEGIEVVLFRCSIDRFR